MMIMNGCASNISTSTFRAARFMSLYEEEYEQKNQRVSKYLVSVTLIDYTEILMAIGGSVYSLTAAQSCALAKGFFLLLASHPHRLKDGLDEIPLAHEIFERFLEQSRYVFEHAPVESGNEIELYAYDWSETEHHCVGGLQCIELGFGRARGHVVDLFIDDFNDLPAFVFGYLFVIFQYEEVVWFLEQLCSAANLSVKQSLSTSDIAEISH
ncbi:hypothetical protein [Pseudomonas abietaniphila]|nr:hypothetical protein [Pseudomonas abietaniphila]